MSSFLSEHQYHLLTLVVFVLLSFWWVDVQQIQFTSDHRQIFAATYGLMALWGAFWGIQTSFKWGGMKSLFGKAILFFSLGLLFQEFGQLVYSYYIYFAKIEVPYPSFGDIGYFGSIPLYAYGAFLLAETSGFRFGLRSITDKIQAFILPIILLIVSYTLFLRGYEFDWTNPLAVFLDFGYPLGQALYISIAVLTYLICRKVLGGLMRSRIILIVVAFFLQYLADFVFLYQNSLGTWEVGRINDYMYLIAYTAMTLALLELRVVYLRLQKTG